MYSPSLGRWMTQDPIGFEAGDTNLYRFVGNEPTGSVDPLGLCQEKSDKPKVEANPPVKDLGWDRYSPAAGPIPLGNGKVAQATTIYDPKTELYDRFSDMNDNSHSVGGKVKFSLKFNSKNSFVVTKLKNPKLLDHERGHYELGHDVLDRLTGLTLKGVGTSRELAEANLRQRQEAFDADYRAAIQRLNKRYDDMTDSGRSHPGYIKWRNERDRLIQEEVDKIKKNYR